METTTSTSTTSTSTSSSTSSSTTVTVEYSFTIDEISQTNIEEDDKGSVPLESSDQEDIS